jgi:hypothetical protein
MMWLIIIGAVVVYVLSKKGIIGGTSISNTDDMAPNNPDTEGETRESLRYRYINEWGSNYLDVFNNLNNKFAVCLTWISQYKHLRADWKGWILGRLNPHRDKIALVLNRYNAGYYIAVDDILFLQNDFKEQYSVINTWASGDHNLPLKNALQAVAQQLRQVEDLYRQTNNIDDQLSLFYQNWGHLILLFEGEDPVAVLK